MFRIGQGFDLHRTIRNGKPLILGGVTLPAGFSLDGHSDADALLHAITDAFLGALALGDIGQWFPDNDPKWKNADSRILLSTVLRHPEFQKWQLENLDCTIFAEQPKINPHKEEIRHSLADLLQVSIDRISVKAKTNEKQDSIGRGEAIAASAILLLSER